MKVGIVGLGAMGAAMARRLEQSEHELRVWNRSATRTEEFAECGIAVASSPRELLECWLMFCEKAVGAEGAGGAAGAGGAGAVAADDARAARAAGGAGAADAADAAGAAGSCGSVVA